MMMDKPRANEPLSDEQLKHLLTGYNSPFVAVVTIGPERRGHAFVAVTEIGTTHPIAVLDTLASTMTPQFQCHTLFGGELITADGTGEA